MSSGSKKVNYAAIGLGAIVGVALPTAGDNITAFCIKVIAIALVTGLGISWQAILDKKDGEQQIDSQRDPKVDV